VYHKPDIASSVVGICRDGATVTVRCWAKTGTDMSLVDRLSQIEPASRSKWSVSPATCWQCANEDGCGRLEKTEFMGIGKVKSIGK
jgi:hypothetical protein